MFGRVTITSKLRLMGERFSSGIARTVVMDLSEIGRTAARTAVIRSAAAAQSRRPDLGGGPDC
jgi:hypothetical protein